MKINKQLFEDVLSGKLKGKFVLSNGSKVRSEKCERCYSFRKYNKKSYTFYDDESGLWFDYYDDGRFSNFNIPTANDIVDFIPDTNMKENELTIEIPDGKIVDWEESKKQNKVVLKDKQLTYEKICEKLFSKLRTFYFVNNHGSIYSASSICNPYIFNPNSASTVHQLECILAKNKLANVAKSLNDGWKPLYNDIIFLLVKTQTGVSVFEIANGSCAPDCGSIWFKSKELAERAIEILGKETIKLALEPLGI